MRSYSTATQLTVMERHDKGRSKVLYHERQESFFSPAERQKLFVLWKLNNPNCTRENGISGLVLNCPPNFGTSAGLVFLGCQLAFPKRPRAIFHQLTTLSASNAASWVLVPYLKLLLWPLSEGFFFVGQNDH